jgi:DNA-binding response OmpR family regulator
MSARILVVDDEPSVTDLLAYNLRKAHYDVLTAADGREALRLASEANADLILLDLMLPEVDGLDVCRELRKSSSVPIIMITARGEETDRVIGLELGADDYLPNRSACASSPGESVCAVPGRRRAARAMAILHGPGNLILDVERRLVTIGPQPIELTRLEFDLLHCLLLHAGKVLSRERLLEQAWGYDFAGDTRAVDSAIKRLRAALRRRHPRRRYRSRARYRLPPLRVTPCAIACSRA